MNALRHFLLRNGVATRLLWGLILAVLLSRALISGAVMLDPDSPGAGGVVLCSGHGPLVIDAPGRSVSFDDASPITPANDAMALASLLSPRGHDASSGGSTPSGSSGAVCAFGAALFVALSLSLLLVVLFPVAAARRVWPRCAARVAACSPSDVGPPSRAPPCLA
ncbi:hypothetical protein [Burkholderia glumae]|uniref:DUF2946 domain-containing protein n=1 Tax=Burkholderia glumae TaxID=337 RepID=A0AAP9XVC5_BURGL|nr:hypothetical protein [Burkholderia glumae]ACR31855.1 Hypothetical protein bglu_2g14980 [Burkholderia glumae BGR1]AJY63496.1 hypothetical protein KS03_4440 [Burkholderia glumae LMG 2196 = ATCC 33617]KHJ59819.1 hypothetical protein NCPPB3923_27345 [Burkholderia glumae]MCM2484966.1 hypothetical protein [Burkholderia glumae]MCM2510659.1 hypothetical protein [Burkholderia glumae]